MTTRPNEDDYQRIVWGQPDQRPPETLGGLAVPVTPASGPQAASGQLEAASGPDRARGPAMPAIPPGHEFVSPGQVRAELPAPDKCMVCGESRGAHSPGPSPADRAWTCRWCGRHHAGVHGDRSPWPDQDTFVMVSRDVRQWLPSAVYPAEAVYTVRDRYVMMLAEIMAYGWPEDRKLLQAFRLADAWCMCLPTRPRRWWKCRDGSYG